MIPTPPLNVSSVQRQESLRTRASEDDTKTRIFGIPSSDQPTRRRVRYTAKKSTQRLSNDERRELLRELQPRVGEGPKRKRVIWSGSQGRRAKQRCIPYYNIPFALGSMKTIPDFINIQIKDHIETDIETVTQEYEDPTQPEDMRYAAAEAKTKLKHSIPNQSVSVSPPRLVNFTIPDGITLEVTSMKESNKGFNSVQQLKQLYEKITSHTSPPREESSKVQSPHKISRDSQVVKTLTSSWKGTPPVHPEELAPVYLNCDVPVTVGLECTVGRAIICQQSQVTSAVQSVILTAGRLKDHLAILQCVYLALDSLLSAEISRIIDSVASGTTSIASATSNIQLALRRVRTSLAFPGIGTTDCSDFASCFSVSIFDDILSTSSTSRSTRSEFAEDYVQMSYLPTERIQHIITEPHLRYDCGDIFYLLL